MYQLEAIVIDKLGLHARPASMLNKMCVKFKSKIKILFGEKSLNLEVYYPLWQQGLRMVLY